MYFKEFIQLEDELEIFAENYGWNMVNVIRQKFPGLIRKYGPMLFKVITFLVMNMGLNIDELTEDVISQYLNGVMSHGPGWLQGQLQQRQIQRGQSPQMKAIGYGL